MSKPIEYYLAPGWEDVHRPRIQELFDRIDELKAERDALKEAVDVTGYYSEVLLPTEIVCPQCNQEMGDPHYCRPNWY